MICNYIEHKNSFGSKNAKKMKCLHAPLTPHPLYFGNGCWVLEAMPEPPSTPLVAAKPWKPKGYFLCL